jgi:hypothetical protein
MLLIYTDKATLPLTSLGVPSVYTSPSRDIKRRREMLSRVQKDGSAAESDIEMQTVSLQSEEDFNQFVSIKPRQSK